MVLSAHWWGNKKFNKKLLKGDRVKMYHIGWNRRCWQSFTLEKWSADRKSEKIATYDFAIPNISQYHDNIVLWLWYGDDIIWWGLWWFPALESNKSSMWKITFVTTIIVNTSPLLKGRSCSDVPLKLYLATHSVPCGQGVCRDMSRLLINKIISFHQACLVVHLSLH